MPIPEDNLENWLKLNDNDKEELLLEWNNAYRKGSALVTDRTYDELLESLPAENVYRKQVGFEVSDNRKSKLPVPMFSMDKVKNEEDIKRWVKSKKIEEGSRVLITPKYDGLSFLHQYGSGISWTRGNGTIGQKSDEHYKVIASSKRFGKVKKFQDQYLIGEVIMNKRIFTEKYSNKFKNPRNLVAGLFNQKIPDQILADVDFIAYGYSDQSIPHIEALALLNEFNTVEVPSKIINIEECTDAYFVELYQEWTQNYEIDGLIMELCDNETRKSLGREKNNNPSYSRAWKGFAENSAQTKIKSIKYQISKEGKLTVVGQLEPIELDGVTVSNVSLYNASSVENNGWGEGAVVRIIRSGMVIPKIIETISPVKCELPEKCHSCSEDLIWDETHINLVCKNTFNCDEQKIQKNIAFFSILEIDAVGEGVVDQLYNAGYKTIDQLTHMDPTKLLTIEGFAEKKAKTICANISEKLQDVALEKIQHASGCFKGLGSKKLALVKKFSKRSLTPTLEEVLTIDGFSEISANSFLAGFSSFWDFIEDIPLKIAKDLVINDRYASYNFVFTGYRDKDIEKKLLEGGAKISSGVSKNTTHVVTKDKESSSSKLDKAKGLGITILDPKELNLIL